MTTDENELPINTDQDSNQPMVDSEVTDPNYEQNIVRFQSSTIEILSSPESKLNLIDSLVEYSNTLIKNAENEKEKAILQQNTVRIIHHLVFYIQHKLELKTAIIHNLGKDLVEAKLKILKTSMDEIFNILSSLSPKNVMNGKIDEIMQENFSNSSRSIWSAVSDFIYKKEKLKKEVIELESMIKSFQEFLPILLNKLYKRRTIIGKSNLICGIIENYSEIIIHQHAQVQKNDLVGKIQGARLSRSKAAKKVQDFMTFTALSYILVLVLLSIIIVVGQLFTPLKIMESWLTAVWSIKYWILAISFSFLAIAWAFDMFLNQSIIKRENAALLKIINDHRIILKAHYNHVNEIYKYFNEQSEVLLSDLELERLIEEKIEYM